MMHKICKDKIIQQIIIYYHKHLSKLKAIEAV